MLAIVGPGAVGTVLAGYLGAAGRPLRLIGTPQDIAGAQAVEGLTVERVTGGPPLQLPRPPLGTSVDTADTSAILLCVKQPDLDTVIAALPADLPDGLLIGVTGNAAGALRRLREALPAQRIVPVTVLFSAQRLEPLHARVSARPRLGIPRDNSEMAQIFANSGIGVLPARGEAGAWGKLLFNLCAPVAAATRSSFREVLTEPTPRRIYTRLLAEGMRSLEAAGIRYQLPVAVPAPIFLRLLKLPGHAAWWAARRHQGLSDYAYPSMVSDVAHGRPTEVDALNGEIVRIASRSGGAAPYNEAICSTLHSLMSEGGRIRISPEALAASLERQAVAGNRP